MRATRGLLASMGAGLSLILAGSAALMFVSALIAFNGWPGVRTERTADERAILAQVAERAAAPDAPAPVAITLPRTAKPAAPAPPRPRRPVKGAAAKRPTTARTVAGKRPAAGAPDPVAADPAPADPAPAAAAAPERKALTAAVSLAPTGQAVKSLGAALDSTVTQTGDALGNLLDPVLPVVSQAAKDATKALGYVIASLTAAAANALAPQAQTATAPSAAVPALTVPATTTAPATVTVPDPAALVTP